MLDNQGLFYDGLCGWAIKLRTNNIISLFEFMLLIDYIDKNAPFLYKINIFKYSTYYWEKGNIVPRIKWLQKHIAKL